MKLSLSNKRVAALPAAKGLPVVARPTAFRRWHSAPGLHRVRSAPQQVVTLEPEIDASQAAVDPAASHATSHGADAHAAGVVHNAEPVPAEKPAGGMNMLWIALGAGLLIAFAQTATGQAALAPIAGMIGEIHIHDAEKAVLEAIWLLLASCVCVPLALAVPGGNAVLGYLLGGAILGPYGMGVTQDVHTLKHIAEMGVVFLLFNIGLELSMDKLQSMAKFVFGMGTAQVLATLAGVAVFAITIAGLSGPSAIILGGALAMSTTAVVIQVLNDRKEMQTEHGQAAFSVLLLQDLAVVVILMLIPLLAPSPDGSSTSMGQIASALGVAGAKAVAAIVGILSVGRVVIKPLFEKINALGNSEIFIATSLLVCLATSMMTQLAGLSLALGAFLAGLLLAETPFAHKVEHEIAPFKGLLLGLFFMTVGMEISAELFAREWMNIVATIVLLVGGKLGIMLALGKAFGLSTATAIKSGLLLAPGGELAFVAFGEAVNKGVLPEPLTAQLYMAVALSMAATPYLAALGEKVDEMFGDKSKAAAAAPAAIAAPPPPPSAPAAVMPAGVAAAGGMLQSSKDQAAAYTFLAAASAVFGAAALCFPTQLLQMELGGAAVSILDTTFARIAGATMILSAAVELCLKNAAEAGRLASATYQRLQLASVLKSAAFLLAFAASPHLWASGVGLAFSTVAAGGVAISAAAYKAVNKGFELPAFDLSLPKTASGWAYSICALLYVATAGACLSPDTAYSGLALTSELLKQAWAPGYLLAALVCLVLKDAADRGRLGASTFRALNLGLAGLEVGYGVAVVDATPLVNLAGSLAIAGFCMFQYLTAKK